jgi:hypothetical protein
MPRRRKGRKKRAMTAHAKRRFMLRYGRCLSKALTESIIGKIQKGQAFCVEKQSNRVSIFDVEHEEQIIRVVYDRTRKVIITALHSEEEEDE